MNDKIIKTSIKIKRNPVISFFLSFFFTGAGETYNGDFSKGVIIFSLKTIAIIIFPLLIFFKETDSYINPFVFIISSALALHFFSAFYASFKSYQKKKNSIKKL
jgi:TM2 domain-containing membrane protein YozV